MYVGGRAVGAWMARDPDIGIRTALLVSELFLVLPGLALISLGPGLRSLGLRRTGLGMNLFTVALGAALWITSAGLFEVQSFLFPPTADFVDAFRRLHASLKPSGVLDGLLSVLAIAVAPALCEETLFRGILLPSLARRLAPFFAILVSAALFAAIHVDAAGSQIAFDRVPFALLMGVALGALRLRTGTLVAPMLAHATVNTLTFLVAPLVDDPSQAVPQPNLALGLALLLTGALGSTALLRRARVSVDLA